MRRAITLAIVFVAAIATAKAQPASKDAETLADKDVPSLVTSRLHCKVPSGAVTRRSFAGGFVFSQACTLSGEPQDRLVFATASDGSNARLLQFHRPEGRRISALGNAVFADNEVSGTVGRLTRRICRAEGRWQMEGKQPSPSLVYWRQTGDCDGKTGWQVMVNRKTPQR